MILTLLALSLFISPHSLPSKSTHPVSCLTYDEYGLLSFDNEKIRLDNYAERLREDPQTVGVILVHTGGKRSFKKSQAMARRIMDYLLNVRSANTGRIGSVTFKIKNPKFETELSICPFFPAENLRSMFSGTAVITGSDVKK